MGEAGSGGGGSGEGLVAELVVACANFVDGVVAVEVDLVEDDDGADVAGVGENEVAVDEVGLAVRLGGAGDDECLVHVGGDGVDSVGGFAREAAGSGCDPLDDAFGENGGPVSIVGVGGFGVGG